MKNFKKSLILQALDEDTNAERILREMKQVFVNKKKNQELRVKSLKNITMNPLRLTLVHFRANFHL